MYSIYADDICIYNDTYSLENLKVVNPRLTLEDSAAGFLSMTLPPSNVGYHTITRMVTDISVRKDGAEIWAGRVLSESRDFWNNRILYCEGELAFFNDSTQPPAEYHNQTVRGFLETLVQIHNSKVAENRRFTVGAVTVRDPNDSIYRYTNFEKTMECINEKLVKRLGGHLRVRKVNGVRYLDYLAEYPNTNSQVIQFGKNLLSFTRKWDMTEFATVVLPQGARLEESPIEALDAYLTVESVNGGSIYVQSPEAVSAYGWIEKVVSWDNVTTASALLRKAKEYLSALQFDSMSIELSALDLHYLDVDYESVKLLDEVRVISRPHGMDRLFPVTKLEIPLDSPENTQFHLGDVLKTGLTKVNNQNSAKILQKIENLPKASTILKEAKENATAIMNLATTGYITITKDQYGSETLYISNDRDYTRASKLWKWSLNGLGYSNDGGKTFGLAITMDGAIVADYISTGVMNADLIKAGVLRDYGSNVSFDLSTGALTMKKGSINLGNGNFTVSSDGTLTAKKGRFEGTLESKSGHIGGFVIESGYLHTGSGNNFVALNGSETNGYSAYAFWAGAAAPSSAPFWVKKNGEFYAQSGTFGGTLNAASGTFKGTVQASDFLDSSGNSMLNGGKFASDYLDLHGITIRNSSGDISFQVAENGTVTIGGTISGSINWSNISNTNLSSNPAYNLASTANGNATAAQSRADSAYTRAGNAATEASNASSAAASAERLAKAIANGTFSGGTFIDGTKIYSPTIYANEFSVFPSNYSSSGSFNLYAYSDGGRLINMLSIRYNWGDLGVHFDSPGIAYWNFERTYLYGIFDCRGAKFEDLTSTATFG